MTKSKSLYTPLYYLSSLGAGGITVAFWKLGDVTQQNGITRAGVAIFWTLSLLLFIINLPFWIKALSKADFFGVSLPASFYPKGQVETEHKTFLGASLPIAEAEIQKDDTTNTSPAVSTGWLSMPTALGMLLNASFVAFPLLLGVKPKDLVMTGFVLWLIAYIFVFLISFQILFNTFSTTTTLKEFHFGLFLQPLAYGMVAVPGVSMSSMLPEPLGDVAVLLGLTAFGIGGIIGSLALIFIVQRFFTYGHPDPEVTPTTLLIMPSITVYSLFVLKTMHYIGHHGVEIAKIFYQLTALMSIGFMGAAATLGLLMLYVYFQNKIPFGPSWWSFVCPFVALSVLSSVTYQFVGLKVFLYSAVVALTFVSIVYIYVGLKTIKVLFRSTSG